MRILKRAARGMLEFASSWKREHREALALTGLEHTAEPRSVQPEERHLHDAIAWIKRAQDSSSGDGVCWGYRMRRPVRTVLPLGWVAPYPETTGYIIPTMLRYAELYKDEDSARRARRMTDWELEIQLPDGGIQGGVYGARPLASSTFVTGQVLFGFVDGYTRFGDLAIKAAAIRAGDWLLSCVDEAGRFVRGYSHFCAPGPKAYEVRTGLALAELGDRVGREDFKDAALRIADYALTCQHPNGWFEKNDLDVHDKPLTHTIGYVLEGLHAIGIRFGRTDCLEAVDRTLQNIVPVIRQDGFLAGRWYKDWTAAVDWACLTGSSQIAGVFLRRYRETGNSVYLDAGRKLLGFVCFTQDLRPGFSGVDGGIRGSYPVQGDYGQWCVLNWATKFFTDSMMDYLAARPVAS